MPSRALALALDLALSSHAYVLSLLPGKGLSLDNRDPPRKTHPADPRVRVEESYPKCTACASHRPMPTGGLCRDRVLRRQRVLSPIGRNECTEENIPESTIEPSPLDNAGHAFHPYPGQFCTGSLACPVQLDKFPHSLHTQTSLTGLCAVLGFFTSAPPMYLGSQKPEGNPAPWEVGVLGRKTPFLFIYLQVLRPTPSLSEACISP